MGSKLKVALPELFRRELEAQLPEDLEVAWYRDVHDVTDAARAADVLVIGFIDADEIRAAIEAAPSARWVSTHAAGIDHYPLEYLRQRGVPLTKGAGINAEPIAEFVVLCVLSAAKGLPSLVAASQRGEWPAERVPASELDGTRALVPNVVITGHSAGRSERSRDRYARLFLDNLQRFRAGEPLANLVDYAAGY